MIEIRNGSDRGHFDHGWLNTYHTFSFGDYQDPKHMGFRSLRVMNEDRVQPGQGFGTHAHRDMEIISYVLEGALEHKDNIGNGSILKAGEFQSMTAGTGVQHSEFNPSRTDVVHFYQIWIIPERRGLEPSYEQRQFNDREKHGQLKLVASRDGRSGSLTLHQDVAVYLCSLDAGEQVTHGLGPGRHAWAQLLRGTAQVNAHPLAAGDGAAISEETVLVLQAKEASEWMLFDLA